eukprot:CAMPEP_0118943362 /NCGR_PEP_ID=MMETSP1169-20130426/38154_1 /TAXON_ID=36882 /ORGANISM="Pyramimonas obovata, Strain CCMP722" /LENGTH=192 /DNA_ID=CAMNT_0006888599 /DNA_START=79 /DNA_END=654 /DNA_ORIENTATION=+
MRGRCTSLLLVLLGVGSCYADVNDRQNAFVGYSEKPSCVDKSENCDGWMTSGECTKNPGYMELNCAKSCNTCGKKEPPLAELSPDQTEILVLTTHLGDIRIKLRPDLAPNTVQQIREFASTNRCNGHCRFYRSEAPAEEGAIDNFGGPGPPYGLVQGGFHGPWKPVQREAAPVVHRGMVCLIGTGPDFFIAV